MPDDLEDSELGKPAPGAIERILEVVSQTITFQTGWEDEGLASVTKLICSCGTNLLEGYTDYIAGHEERIDCPKCGKKYQFIWEGMTIKEVA